MAKLIGDSVGVDYEIEWYGEPDTRSYRVDFGKINRILGFKTSYTPKDGAKEIYDALKDGIVKDGPEMYVINWYKKLVEEGVLA